ncbi:MAG: iron-containing redox enzyme family protein [Gemmatimonadota bacterium]|jgi:hypothetical protein
MTTTDVNRDARRPTFNGADPALAPAPTRLSYRKAYYHLVNVEEHPEVLPLAYDVVTERLDAQHTDSGGAPSTLDGARAKLTRVLEELAAESDRYSRPWQHDTEDLTRRQVLHYFVQFMPVAFIDGCWLQCGLRVATAHTRVGAAMTGLYQHQVRAFVSDPGRHFVADYRAVYSRLGAPLEEVSTHSFALRPDFGEAGFALPIFLLSLAQFTRTFPGEILGVNLAWQFLGLSAFGPDLIRDTSKTYALPPMGGDLADPDYLETGRDMARDAALGYLEEVGDEGLGEAWETLMRGVRAGVQAWEEWFGAVEAAAPAGPPDPRQEMIDMLWRKAPHAQGYHAERRLGATKIDDFLDPENFDAPGFLEALAESPWVRTSKKTGKSALLGRLIDFGGPMLAVFSPVEQEIIQNWIDSLPGKKDAADEQAASSTEDPTPRGPTIREELHVEGRSWTKDAFGNRSQSLYGKASLRELYHYLINVEFHPGILPVAERWAHDRLERSMAMLVKGERPIPSKRYDPEALERWVHKKHRDQVDSYRPPDKRPDAPKDAFIETTVQLAPLILIDGGWLQGMASPALIHTTVGRMLFHVLVEELGEGKPDEHHANVYRDLLAAMGEDAPPVDTMEFANWARLYDESFEVPTLWLAISCFPRHFLPEILGLNLAVELAGVGGPYMEARDTLRHFGYPTLFVDVHNAADNVSVGHAAWAMNAIKRYMDDVMEREGPHNVDRVWHRVWTGVRATLPQIGRVRLMAHKLRQRFFGEDPRLVPLIFPS